jgi:Zn-dependent peptidase ImmA (M78 family)
MRIDGASLFATKDNKPFAAAVVSSNNLSGDRQRFNFAHELGHLVLSIGESIDSEKAANRFAGALLVPSKTLRSNVRNKNQFTLQDLLELKHIFKVSIQSILHRLKDLDLISDYYYTSWCKNISRYGWRKNEPDPLPLEESNCLEEIALKTIDGGYVSVEEAEKIIGHGLPALRANTNPIDLIKLSLADRRKILKAQAEKDARRFNEDLAEWESWEGDYDEET